MTCIILVTSQSCLTFWLDCSYIGRLFLHTLQPSLAYVCVHVVLILKQCVSGILLCRSTLWAVFYSCVTLCCHRMSSWLTFQRTQNLARISRDTHRNTRERCVERFAQTGVWCLSCPADVDFGKSFVWGYRDGLYRDWHRPCNLSASHHMMVIGNL